jgi:hypothetical protein
MPTPAPCLGRWRAASYTLVNTIDTDTSNIVTSVQILDNAISGNEMQVDVLTAPDSRSSWRVSTLSFTTTNDSDTTFTVPATTEYQILSVYVTLASTATVGNRLMVIRFTDTSDVVLGELVAGVTQAASLTYRYMWGPGLAQETALRDTTYIANAMMPIFLGAADKIRIYDKTAVDAAADDMTVKIQIASRSVA